MLHPLGHWAKEVDDTAVFWVEENEEKLRSPGQRRKRGIKVELDGRVMKREVMEEEKELQKVGTVQGP